MRLARAVVPLLVIALSSCSPEDSKPRLYTSRLDALSNSVVLSQVYGGGGNANATYTHDFVELFNRGTTNVSLTGWSLQYAAAGGSSWSQVNLTGSIPAGRYLLVRLGTQNTPAGAALPAHDLSDTTVGLSGTSGKLALVSNTTALTVECPTGAGIVDFVGYGTAATCSETSPTANLSSTLSAQRKLGGCTETDNNSADFATATPSARNSSTAAFNCATADAGVDAGTVDAGPADAGAADAGADAGVADAGTVDAGVPDASCVVLNAWPGTWANGGYFPPYETASAEVYSEDPELADGGMNVLRLEAFYGGGLTLPATVTFSPGDTYGACEVCPILATGCNALGQCGPRYFAQGGSATVTAATEDEDVGQFIGSMSNVRFVRWNFGSDQAVAGGGCFIVSANINVSWDAGVGAGGGGGSTGGGGGSTGTGGGGGSAMGGGGGSTGTGGGGGTGTGGGGSTGTGGGGAEADAGAGGGAGGGGGSEPPDAGELDAGSATGGGGGGAQATGGGMGGGFAGFGGGFTGGGGGSSTGGGCGCTSTDQALLPMLAFVLGALRVRRKR